MNAQLDQDIENFKDQASTDNLNVLGTLNRRRKQFASFLNDPLPYSFEGGSVFKIAEVAAQDMQLQRLRNMTIDKLDILDQLHADQMKLIELRNIESLLKREQMRELRKALGKAVALKIPNICSILNKEAKVVPVTKQ